MTSWWATEPGNRTEWIVHAVGVAAAAPLERLLPGGGRPRSPARLVHQRSGPKRRSGGGVELLLVMPLDDLGRVEVTSGLALRTASSERRPRRSWEPRRRHSPCFSLSSAISSRSSSLSPVVPTTTWIPFSMQKTHVVLHALGNREVDGDLGPRFDQPASSDRRASTRATSRARRRPRRPCRPRSPSARRLRAHRPSESSYSTSRPRGGRTRPRRTVRRR